MKNRRNIIVAFVLVAALAIGVGYATLSGTLTIGGNATFNGKAALSGDVKTAVKFTGHTAGLNCTSTNITDGGLKATMDVVFNDTTGDADEFTGVATYKITYDSTDMTLPSVKLDKPIAEISGIIAEDGTDNGKYTISAQYQTVVNNGGTVDIVNNTVTLAPGQSVDVLVTVIYDNSADDVAVESSKVEGTIDVKFNYNTVG